PKLMLININMDQLSGSSGDLFEADGCRRFLPRNPFRGFSRLSYEEIRGKIFVQKALGRTAFEHFARVSPHESALIMNESSLFAKGSEHRWLKQLTHSQNS
ncbi:hypothetical protein, partial [Sutterella wadsworthensis]|uniref:hypothetical protein n=1 Tax=Sutterella wadsworthensis TaxID=40545 RepID=UPI00307F4D1E